MMQVTKDEYFRQRLTEYLEAVMNTEAVEIEQLKALSGGISRVNWLVETLANGEKKRFVLQCDRGAALDEQTLSRDQEFEVMKTAFENKVNTPAPRWYCVETAILDTPFIITDHTEGTSIGQQIIESDQLAEARRLLPEQIGEQLAQIHAIDLKKHALSFLPAPQQDHSPAQEMLDQIRTDISRLGVHNPVFEFGWRWAHQHIPACEQPVLVHGDFRVGNFLVSSKGLNGIIDWEYAHIGDPLEDLAWLSLRDWRYGKGHLKLGGIAPNTEPFIRAYERASGRKVDRKALLYWEILGNLRWAVTCLARANRATRTNESGIELTALGTRSVEMQLEMLHLIGQGEN